MRHLAVIICSLLLASLANAQDAAPLLAWVMAGGSNPDVLSGLVAWWKLDGNANDSISTNNGIAYGATATNFNGRACYSFNGSSDYIRIPASSDYKQNHLSYGALVYPRSKVAYGKVLCLDYRSDGSSYAPFVSLDLESSDGSTGIPVSRVSISGALYPYPGGANSGTRLALNKWTFLMATYDGTDLKLYQNGSLKMTVSVAGVVDYGTSLDLSIGSYSPYYNRENFNGLIDDVRIYNRALTSNEVVRIYNLYK